MDLSEGRCCVDSNTGEGAVGLQDPQEGAKLRKKLESVSARDPCYLFARIAGKSGVLLM